MIRHAASTLGLVFAVAVCLPACQRQDRDDATLPHAPDIMTAMPDSPFANAHERLAALPPDDTLASLRGAASLARLQGQVAAQDYALVPSLGELATHERPAIRAAAIDLLGQLVAASDSPGVAGADAAAGIEEHAARAAGIILRGLDDEDGNVRLEAVVAARAIPGTDALEPLRSRLHDPSALVRFQALHALHERGDAAGDARIQDDARGLHDDPDERVRDLARLIAP